jgi:uncharacterized protein
MVLIDVNVFIYAHRLDAADHSNYRDWLAGQIAGKSNIGFSDQILSSVVRIITHPGIYVKPTPLDEAFRFVHRIRDCGHAVRLNAGQRHWSIFLELCQSVKARGNLVSDCWHAALAIEHGCEWITVDRHFARFPGLRWRHPLD